MPFAHGTYSVGVLVGAVGAGLARGAGVGREPILLAIAICIALTGLSVIGDTARVQPSRRRASASPAACW